MSLVNRSLRVFFTDPRLLFNRVAILSLSVGLAAIGVFFVHSTTAMPGDPFPGGDSPGQLLKLTVGIALLLAVMSIDYRSLERYAYVFYGILLIVLGGLLGLKYAGGAAVARWVSLGGLNIQPSELMKVALVLVLARYLRYRKDQVRLGGLIRPILLTTIPMGFVVLQPDLGTSLMLPPILLVLLYVANAKRVHLSVAVFGGVLLFPAVLTMNAFFPQLIRSVFKDYQMMRLVGFANQTAPGLTDINYQLRQSLIAFGSGGWTGKGYHAGTQNLGNYVPAKDTDFIFSIIGEELGFLGAAAVVVVYSLLVLSILNVALNTREPFSRLVVTGIATIFVFQGFENFGMTLGLTPITGLPLPFVSAGGSSLVTSCVSIGIVLEIAGRRVTIVASPDLNPHDDPDSIAIFDDSAAGANLYPNSPY